MLHPDIMWQIFILNYVPQGVPLAVTDCPNGIWCGVFTTCLLFISPHFVSVV